MNYFKQFIFSMIAIIIAILFVIIVSSCGGTRKTDISKTETINDNINIENTYLQQTKTILGSTFTYTPFDGLKPMIIEGRKFENAIVSGGNTKETTNTTYLNKKYNVTKTISIQKIKSVDRTDNTFLYLGMFLIIVIAIWSWFYFNRYR